MKTDNRGAPRFHCAHFGRLRECIRQSGGAPVGVSAIMRNMRIHTGHGGVATALPTLMWQGLRASGMRYSRTVAAMAKVRSARPVAVPPAGPTGTGGRS